MSHSATADSPRYGYAFDGQESNVVRVRKARRCDGGRRGRSGDVPGKRAPDCTGTIEPGDIACTTIDDLFRSDTYACVPCALAVGSIKPSTDAAPVSRSIPPISGSIPLTLTPETAKGILAIIAPNPTTQD